MYHLSSFVGHPVLLTSQSYVICIPGVAWQGVQGPLVSALPRGIPGVRTPGEDRVLAHLVTSVDSSVRQTSAPGLGEAWWLSYPGGV